MEVFAPGKVMHLGDVPAGGVFGLFDRGNYIRFLRTAVTNTAGDQIAVVSLGPFADDDYDLNSQGPTSYLWEADTQVVFEEKTAISPKQETLMDGVGQHIPLGAIVMSRTGQTCIKCRSGSGSRVLVDLFSGERVKDERALTFYERYVLVGLNELQKRHVIFDSAKSIGKTVFASA